MDRRSDFGSGGLSPRQPLEVAPAAMKWGADGELSATDLQAILQRLSAVDEQAATLMDCPLDRSV